MEDVTAPTVTTNLILITRENLQELAVEILERHNPDHGFWNTEEVCEYYSCTRQFLYKLEKNERLIPKRVGRKLFYDVEEVKRLPR